MLPAYLVPNHPQSLAAEFDYASACDTDQVVVRLPPDNHLVVRPLVIQKDLLADSRILQVRQRPVHRGPAGVVTQPLQVRHQPVRIKQPLFPQRRVQNHGPFRREFQPLLVQVPPEDRTNRLVWQHLATGRGVPFRQAWQNVWSIAHYHQVYCNAVASSTMTGCH